MFNDFDEFELKFPKKIGEKISYRRRFSLGGNGVYNLFYLNNNIYELKMSKCKSLGVASNKAVDAGKSTIIEEILSNIPSQYIKSIDGAKIYCVFPFGNVKIEIIKKLREPADGGLHADEEAFQLKYGKKLI